MKINLTFLLIIVLTGFIAEFSSAQPVPVQKKTKLVTYDNQIIMTWNWTIKKDSLLYRNTQGNYSQILLTDLKSISIKKGSMFPWIMMASMSTGVGYSYLNSAIPKNHKMKGGLITGLLAGFIVAPFFKQPLTLIYYDGTWRDEKFKPK